MNSYEISQGIPWSSKKSPSTKTTKSTKKSDRRLDGPFRELFKPRGIAAESVAESSKMIQSHLIQTYPDHRLRPSYWIYHHRPSPSISSHEPRIQGVTEPQTPWQFVSHSHGHTSLGTSF